MFDMILIILASFGIGGLAMVVMVLIWQFFEGVFERMQEKRHIARMATYSY